jgi:hypothetical protein
MVGNDQIAPTSLEWASRHVERFGDTDIFPVPFEFDAIRASWLDIKNELASINLMKYRTRSPQILLMPKSRTSYRAAVQLDPLDALVYAALIYEAAENIEKYRVPETQNIACSFRLHVTADGSLFEKENGWPRFHERSVELANSGKFTHVLIADIADFYNQVSHHRVTNVLQLAGVAGDRSKNIEGFLSKLTAMHSRGLPVGPAASIVLAEASLDDVDKFLISRGLSYVRYVDDFRIFCGSEREAVDAAYALAEYLYTAHRLVLTPSKTKLYSVKKFVTVELLDPKEQEERGKVSKLKSRIEEILENTGYHIDFEELPESDLKQVTRENLKELLRDAVNNRPLHIGLTRYLLRRAKYLRTTAVQKIVLDNLTKLAPIMREVIGYLSLSAKDQNVEAIQNAMLEHLSSSAVGTLPFVRMWGLELFIKRPLRRFYPKVMKIAEDSRATLGVRPIALLARAHKELQWVRAQKETWSNHSPWDRRAIIWAASVMGNDERKHWCKLVKETAPDSLDRAVATLAAQ